MVELMFLFTCILIYLSSFLYRRISILASFIVLYTAFSLEVNLSFILSVMLFLTLVRFKKSGVKDEI